MSPRSGGAAGAETPVIAYFSMEIGFEAGVPTYAGGLGVLAGDTLRAAADLGVPLVGVTLLHRKGYFRQRLGPRGGQKELPVEWTPEERLRPLAARVEVALEGRPVRLRAWRYLVAGNSPSPVPVYLLDADLPENAPQDRALTDHLYGGDDRYRLRQEAVLGLGGVAMLRELGYGAVRVHHMNEGHSALLALALLEETERPGDAEWPTPADLEAVRRRCVFTTHTPVPAGHDQFDTDLIRRVLGEERAELLERTGAAPDGVLNLTHLALFMSRYLNGVAMRHRQVSLGLFPGYPVASITNGVHAPTWVAPPFASLFDRMIPEWRRENFNLRYAIGIPLAEIDRAHRLAKRELLAEVEARNGTRMDPEVLTIGFARRATAYKRATLVFDDLDRLRAIAREVGPIQFVFAGKAHPQDQGGKAMIRRIFQAAARLGPDVAVVYLPDYEIDLAARLCAGVDVWLNTPQKPQEASGTSGMKAALNGVPSLSVLDGWWIEGHVEGVTGWSIGETWELEPDPGKESEALYDKLQREIVPMFYGRPTAFQQVMRSAISLNGSFFTAERMLLQYAVEAYRLPPLAGA